MRKQARAYATTLYKSMIRGLNTVRDQESAIRPCGIAAISVIALTRTDFNRNKEVSNKFTFTHKSGEWEFTVDPEGSYNDVISEMARNEILNMYVMDPMLHEILDNVNKRLDELFKKGPVILGQSLDEQHESS
jgi:hypothetical protein